MLHMPGLVFIDQDGIIRAQYEGKDSFLEDERQPKKNIRAELEKLMGPPPVKKASQVQEESRTRLRPLASTFSSAPASGTLPCAIRALPPPRPPAAVSAAFRDFAGIQAGIGGGGQQHRRRIVERARKRPSAAR